MIYIGGDTQRPFAPNFMVLPSLSCPAACKYCFGPNKGPKMDEKMARDAVDYIEQICVETGQRHISVTLHGGEPLMADVDILELIISELDNRFDQVDFSIQSNLWLLTERHCKLFAEYGVSIGTSIDGPREINDVQRGEGYFDNTMRGIRLARAHGLGVGAIATFTRYSVPHWREVFRFFEEEQIPFSMHTAISSIDNRNGFEMSIDAHDTLMHEAFMYYKMHSDKLRVNSFDTLCKSVANGRGAVCTFKECFGQFLVISPSGNLYSCQRFADDQQYRLGCIEDRPTAEDILKSDMAKRMLAREKAAAAYCGSCEHYGYCKGGCAYTAMTEEKAVSEVFCTTTKRMFDDIKKELIEDMVSEQNMQALEKYGPATNGIPLLRAGRAIALTKRTSPFAAVRNAKRVIAAYELARCNDDVSAAVESLLALDIGKTRETIRISLKNMKAQIARNGKRREPRQLRGKIRGNDCFNAMDILETGFYPSYLLNDEAHRLKDCEHENQCEMCSYRYICGGLSSGMGTNMKPASTRWTMQKIYAEKLYRAAMDYLGITL